jgi:ElaB/YqjD/DUF883 family membrane-anchored ribosome-binding protein
MAKLKKTLRKSAVDLHDDLDNIKDSLAALTHDFKTRAAEMFANSLDHAKDKTYEIQDDMEEFVGNKPYHSIGAALLVGFVVGFFLRHKD